MHTQGSKQQESGDSSWRAGQRQRHRCEWEQGPSGSKALLGAGETVTGEAREVARNQVTQRQLSTG